MNIQTSNSVSAINIKLRTTLMSINQDVDGLPESLFADLGKAGIQPTGPMMFLYDGITDNPNTEIDLRIAIPVSVNDAERYNGSNKTFRLEPFHFVESVLHGDLAMLGPKAYEPLFAQIQQSGLSMTGFCREVYQNFVDMQSEDNETRVQVGVKPA